MHLASLLSAVYDTCGVNAHRSPDAPSRVAIVACPNPENQLARAAPAAATFAAVAALAPVAAALALVAAADRRAAAANAPTTANSLSNGLQ